MIMMVDMMVDMIIIASSLIGRWDKPLLSTSTYTDRSSSQSHRSKFYVNGEFQPCLTTRGLLTCKHTVDISYVYG